MAQCFKRGFRKELSRKVENVGKFPIDIANKKKKKI